MSASEWHWIVPARRAVLRGSVSYGRLLRGWIASLEAESGPLQRWYGVDDSGYQAGLAALRTWLESTVGEEASPAARERTTTLDTPPAAFRPRLWKGPLRVLLEAEAKPSPLSEEIANPREVELEHGGTVRLRSNAQGEVTNPDARFLRGDVVEFPVFKFLGACGLSDYGNPPAFDDRLAFNGDGSYLLGTSVQDARGDSPPSSGALHDNLVAMRFQMLLDGCLGAFHHLDQEVFSDRAGAPHARDGRRSIHARGFIYAGVLGRPNLQPRYSNAEDHWRVANLHWGATRDGSLPRALPTRSGLQRLGSSAVVTPGMTCSPTTLFLSYYMMRHFADGAYGRGSVGRTFEDDRAAAMENSYRLWEAEEVAELVPRVSEQELRERLERLLERVERVVDLVHGEASFMRTALSEARAGPGWESGVRSYTDRVLGDQVDSLPDLLAALRRRFRRRSTPEEEHELLEGLHARLVDGIHEFRRELDALLESSEWADFSEVPPDFGRNWIENAVERVRSVECEGGPCRRRHAARAVKGLGGLLRRKRRALERRRRSDRPLGGGARRRVVDLSDRLSEVNTISMYGHEIAVVRLHAHEKLTESGSLPRAGFMAAYHPLSGEPFYDESCMPEGQFFLFEEGGSLYRWRLSSGETYSLFGCGPFRWRKISRNRFGIKVRERGDRILVQLGDGEQPRRKRLRGIIRLDGPDGGAEALASAHRAEPRSFRPIFVHPVSGLHGAEGARARMVTNGGKLYAARAVPYPTLSEVRDGFASPVLVWERQRLLLARVWQELPPLQMELVNARYEEAEAESIGGREERRRAARKVRRLERDLERLERFVKALGG